LCPRTELNRPPAGAAGTHRGRAERVGTILTGLGRHDEARLHLEQALTLARERRHRTAVAAILDSLGHLAQATGRHPAAVEHYEQTVSLLRCLGDTYNLAGALERLGDSRAALDDPASARQARDEAMTLYRQQGRNDDVRRVAANLDTAK
jgi:tetratricopeptide (TPR) repeat protein